MHEISEPSPDGASPKANAFSDISPSSLAGQTAVAGTVGLQPRVMLVTDSREPSGVGEHMITLACALQGHADVSLVFADVAAAADCAGRARTLGFPTFVIPADALMEGGPAFSAVLDAWRPRVVHVHAGINWEGHGPATAARAFGGAELAVIRTEHLPYLITLLRDPELEAAYAQSLQMVDRVICVCEAARRTFRMAAARQALFAVVRNGISLNTPARDRETVRRALGLRNARVILTVARFTEQKCHRVLLDALPGLLGACPDACLAWVGEGPEKAALQARAAAMRVADRILFLGQRNDVPDLMAAADVFCLPSVFEGHPLVILEAMAAGLPVVATRSLGVTETVCNGHTGLLVKRNDAPALTAALARLLTDYRFAEHLGAQARVAYREHFTADRMAQDTVTVYRDVLGKIGTEGVPVPPHHSLLADVNRIRHAQERINHLLSVHIPFLSRRRVHPLGHSASIGSAIE